MKTFGITNKKAIFRCDTGIFDRNEWRIVEIEKELLILGENGIYYVVKDSSGIFRIPKKKIVKFLNENNKKIPINQLKLDF